MHARFPVGPLAAIAGSGLLLASCSAVPTAAPKPAPAAARPAPVVAQTVPAPLPASTSWRDAPITPGTWTWERAGQQSVASFAGGELALVCDPPANAVTLLRRGVATASVPATILTTISTLPATAIPIDRLPPHVAITFAPRDSALDAMAFSRGRFAVEVQGLPTIIAPSWAEVSRVIEDCR